MYILERDRKGQNSLREIEKNRRCKGQWRSAKTRERVTRRTKLVETGAHHSTPPHPFHRQVHANKIGSDWLLTSNFFFFLVLSYSDSNLLLKFDYFYVLCYDYMSSLRHLRERNKCPLFRRRNRETKKKSRRKKKN